MSGLERIPIQAPAEWDPDWFSRFVREVLAPADARNALGAGGITIGRGAGGVATITGAGQVVASGLHAGPSFTLTATPGNILMLRVSGIWNGSAAVQNILLNYNGSPVASQAVKLPDVDTLATLHLQARVTAVASAACTVTVAAGTIFNPAITWLELTP